jgi:hypothetical protein
MGSEDLRLLLEFLMLPLVGYVAKSINELNIKIAVVISQLSDHSDRIKRLEEKEL